MRMSPTNVLLITVDSLRFDSVAPSASTPGEESYLSGSRGDGHVFTNAYATGPGTTPSFPALLFGTQPLSYGGLGPISEDRPRIAEHLRKAGLSTAAFHCNPFLSTHFNYDLGFETFEDYQNPLMGIATRLFPRGIELSNPRLRRIDEALHLTDLIKKSYRLCSGKPRPYVSAEVVTDDAVQWLETVDSPFFCWTHYMDVHHPCYPPVPYRNRVGLESVNQEEVSEWYSRMLRDPVSLSDSETKALKNLYRAAIWYVDDQVGRVFDALDRTGAYEETLVVITSDHGELFGEYGKYGKPERMYDELLHVPLIVQNGPEYLGTATDDLVSLVDIPPLIHDSIGLEAPTVYEGRVPGRDETRELILAEHQVGGDVVIGARSDNWLYEYDGISSETRLFKITDHLEEVSVANHSREASPVLAAVDMRLDEVTEYRSMSVEPLPDEIEARLKYLGYQ
jgi:arylsulfatase A-like enzyme